MRRRHSNARPRHGPKRHNGHRSIREVGPNGLPRPVPQGLAGASWIRQHHREMLQAPHWAMAEGSTDGASYHLFPVPLYSD